MKHGYLLPHGALLYKAKFFLGKDRHVLDAAKPPMDAEARAWLAAALIRGTCGLTFSADANRLAVALT